MTKGKNNNERKKPFGRDKKKPLWMSKAYFSFRFLHFVFRFYGLWCCFYSCICAIAHTHTHSLCNWNEDPSNKLRGQLNKVCVCVCVCLYGCHFILSVIHHTAESPLSFVQFEICIIERVCTAIRHIAHIMHARPNLLLFTSFHSFLVHFSFISTVA